MNIQVVRATDTKRKKEEGLYTHAEERREKREKPKLTWREKERGMKKGDDK